MIDPFLPRGFRPLVGRMARLRPPDKPCKFYGHYFVEKVRQQMQREEMVIILPPPPQALAPCSFCEINVGARSPSRLIYLFVYVVQRNAVSTSHCSQPNTLEFEMGVEWALLHEKSAGWWRELHEVDRRHP